MQEQKFEELENRASESAHLDAIRKLEARVMVQREIESMKAEGTALALSDEEVEMLQSFRRFKLRMTKNGEVFKWQSRIPEGVVLAEETSLIAHPNEL